MKIESKEQYKLAWDRLDTIIAQPTLTQEEQDEFHKLSEATLEYLNERMEEHLSRYARTQE